MFTCPNIYNEIIKTFNSKWLANKLVSVLARALCVCDNVINRPNGYSQKNKNNKPENKKWMAKGL